MRFFSWLDHNLHWRYVSSMLRNLLLLVGLLYALVATLPVTVTFR